MIFVPFLAVKYNCNYMFVRTKILQLVSFLLCDTSYFYKKRYKLKVDRVGKNTNGKKIKGKRQKKQT
jgi:hypothetical protein